MSTAEHPLTDDTNALEPGKHDLQALARLSAEQLHTTVELMVHEWMIGHAIPVERADTASFNAALAGLHETSQRMSVIHAVEGRIGKSINASGAETITIEALTSAVSAAVQTIAPPAVGVES